MNRIGITIKWQLKNLTRILKGPILFFLILDLLLFVLPYSVCRYLDTHVPLMVHLINLCYAFSLLLMFLFVIEYLENSETSLQHERSRLALPPAWRRLLAKLLATTVFSLLCFLNALSGSWLMSKFADENHSYLKITMGGNLVLGFLLFAISYPLFVYTFRLFTRKNGVGTGKAVSLIALLLFGELLFDLTNKLPSILSFLLFAALTAYSLWQASLMEEKLEH